VKTTRRKNGCGGAAGSSGKTGDGPDRNTAERELAPPLSYRINDVRRLTGLGRTTIYKAIKTGALGSKT